MVRVRSRIEKEQERLNNVENTVIFSFSSNLLSTYYMLDAVVDPRDRELG